MADDEKRTAEADGKDNPDWCLLSPAVARRTRAQRLPCMQQ